MTIAKAVGFLIAPFCLSCLVGCLAAPRAKGSWIGTARGVTLYDNAGNATQCLEFIVAEERSNADAKLTSPIQYAADLPLLTKRNGECLPISAVPTNVHIRVTGTLGVHQQILLPGTAKRAYRAPGQVGLSSLQVSRWDFIRQDLGGGAFD
jgi:hypothetical protein